MDSTVFPALIVFAAISFTVGGAYLLLSSLAGMLAGLMNFTRATRPVSCRPGEVVHQALKLAGRRWDRYRTAALLFLVSLALLITLGRNDWWPVYADRVWVGIGAALLFVITFGFWQMVRLVRYRQRLKVLLDTHHELAQRLTEAQMRGNRVFHAVPVGDSVIDNIVVGSQGVYTINLVQPPHKSCTSVEFKRHGLRFLPGALRNDLKPYRESLVALSRELSACAGTPITVQPVVVIPDCRIEETEEEGPLLVSMESCTAFVGWKNKAAFLMEDEIMKINDWLSRQTQGQESKFLRRQAAGLKATLDRPVVA